MGAAELGGLVEAVRDEREWSLQRCAVEIGVLPNGKVLNEAQVGRILKGERRLDPWMVVRLIAVFDLDPAEAWAASGLLPPETTAEDLRAIWERAAIRRMTAAGRVASQAEGARLAANASSSSDPNGLMRACAPSAGQGMPEAA